MVVRLSVFKGSGALPAERQNTCFYTGSAKVGAKLKKEGIHKRLRKITHQFRLDKNRKINLPPVPAPTNTPERE